MEKAVSCYKADWLVASLPSLCSVQSSLAVRKFRAAGKQRCKRGHGWVCANFWCLMSWHPKRNCSYVSSADLPSDSICKNLAWWVVTRTENLEKPQNCQNWGVGACSGMGACSGQYGTWVLSYWHTICHGNNIQTASFTPPSTIYCHHSHIVVTELLQFCRCVLPGSTSHSSGVGVVEPTARSLVGEWHLIAVHNLPYWLGPSEVDGCGGLGDCHGDGRCRGR